MLEESCYEGYIHTLRQVDQLAHQPWHRSFDQVTRDTDIRTLHQDMDHKSDRIYQSIDHLIWLLEISRYLNLNVGEILSFFYRRHTHRNNKKWMTNQIDLSIYLNIDHRYFRFWHVAFVSKTRQKYM